jgi:hypothetical protein
MHPLRPARSAAAFPAARQRGSVLLVALILCGVIGISLGSYLLLSGSSLKLANRSFFNTSAINLAETGIEEALWSFNQATAGVAVATAWSGWTVSGNNAKRTFTDFSLSGGATASVRVLVIDYNPVGSVQPKVYSEATVSLPNDSLTLTKVVEVDLRRRSRFAMGLVARNQITFNGNIARVDSWNSLYNDDGTPRGSPVPYSAAVRHASGSVGSTSVAVGSVAINNADIFGYASVGGSSSSGISVGTNGIISGNFSATAGTVDTSRIATDFTANFDAVTNPASIYLGGLGATVGTAGTTISYTVNGPITNSFTVYGNVTLIILPDGSGNALRFTGGDTLTLDTGATLTVYTSGDFDLRGNGLINPSGQATAFQLYGTGNSSQDIDLGGTADFTGLVYAPEANVTIHGTPDVGGSIVANNITVVGNAKFHYDESLANFGGNNPFGVVKWRELTTPADRTAAFTAW